jgi:hypothetical protein
MVYDINGNRYRRFNNFSKKLLTTLYLANPFLKLLKSGEIGEDVLNDKVREFYD